MLFDMKKELIALICNGKLKEALDLLFFSSRDSDQINEVVILLFTHNRIRMKQNQFSFEEEMRYLSKIAMQAIHCASELDKDQSNSEQKNIQKL
jgi:hypothetical protein